METITRSCPNCGIEYQIDPSRLKHGRGVTCGRKCQYEWRKKQPSIKVALTCATCGKEFEREPSKLSRVKHGVFCSRECHYAGRGTGATKRVVTKPYTYTPEGKAAMSANGKIPHKPRVYHWVTCANCQKEFDDPRDGRKRKDGIVFCSLDCCNAYRKGEKNPAWRGGYPGYYGPDWRACRRAARKRDDYTCRRCGKVSKPPHRAPDVHHINPVSSFDDRNEANTLDNVICLCHLCHMHVEWHGIDFPL